MNQYPYGRYDPGYGCCSKAVNGVCPDFAQACSSDRSHEALIALRERVDTLLLNYVRPEDLEAHNHLDAVVGEAIFGDANRPWVAGGGMGGATRPPVRRGPDGAPMYATAPAGDEDGHRDDSGEYVGFDVGDSGGGTANNRNYGFVGPGGLGMAAGVGGPGYSFARHGGLGVLRPQNAWEMEIDDEYEYDEREGRPRARVAPRERRPRWQRPYEYGRRHQRY